MFHEPCIWFTSMLKAVLVSHCSMQQPESFTCTWWINNNSCTHHKHSWHFHPPNCHHVPSCAELAFIILDLLLSVKSVAQPKPSSIEAIAVLVNQPSSEPSSIEVIAVLANQPSLPSISLVGELMLLSAIGPEHVPPNTPLSPHAPIFMPQVESSSKPFSHQQNPGELY